MPKLEKEMKLQKTYLLILSFFLIFGSCKTENKRDNKTQSKIETKNITTTETITSENHANPIDTTVIDESFQETDLIRNDYLTEELKLIRINFKKINSIEKWDLIKEKNLWETTEGGFAKYYFSNDSLKKIIVRRFGETFQYLSEFYLLNGDLSFVFEKLYEYNRPITYDSINMVENNDNQVFDFDKSEIIEDRSYFLNGILVHQLNNQDCGAPFADDYLLEEQKRIITEYKNLLKAIEK